MSEFSDILDQVERVGTSEHERTVLRFFPGAALTCVADCAPPPTPAVLSAYLATSGSGACVRKADLKETFTRELRAARTDVMKLKALRREVAWRLHPDRDPTDPRRCEALARLNAEIDDAISRAPQRSRIRPA